VRARVVMSHGRGHVMNFLAEITGLFGKKPTEVRFIGHEREGGYIYLSSPELKGFNFMLEPDERSLRAIIDAIAEPLQAYLEAKRTFEHAKGKRKRARPDLTGMRITQHNPMNLVAEFCPA
jgi:hypothetical protein